ncbi:hypothetical protein DFH08DRAFT_1087880 [Mycena albidolilacea]|uniref:Uncharacterized protein n=1 Tax=Mycena albidolilacea TaxID=1033008 RepID=A0AAD6Z8R6_9AGAR|nr:hypothetical protein DFH08DRAFT_1087880 [Mycena albidolilacea]
MYFGDELKCSYDFCHSKDSETKPASTQELLLTGIYWPGMASTGIANLIGSQPPSRKGIKRRTLLLRRLLLPTSTFSQPSPQKLALKTLLIFALKLQFRKSSRSTQPPYATPHQAAQFGKGARLLQRLRLKKEKANVSSVYIRLVMGEDAVETDTAAHTATFSFGSHVPLRRMVPHCGQPVYNVVPRSAEALIPLYPSGSLSNSPSLYQDSSRPRQHHGISKFFGLRSQTLRLPTGLSLPAPQTLVNRSQLHTSGTPRPSRILRPIGHRRTRSSSPCVLCGAPAPSPPHAASGVSLESDFTVLEIPSAFVPVLEDVKIDEPAREITTETAVAVKVDVPLGGCTSQNGGIRDSDRAGKRRRPQGRRWTGQFKQTWQRQEQTRRCRQKHKRSSYPRKFHLLPDPLLPPVNAGAPGIKVRKGPARKRGPTDIIQELTEVIARRKTAGTIRPPQQDPPPPPPLPPIPRTLNSALRPWRSTPKEKENGKPEPKVTPRPQRSSPNSKKATKEADAKVAGLKTWRRPSPMKAKKMVEPEEEGELFKMFRDREAGGRRLPLGVNINVADGSVSTDPQAAQIRRIVVPRSSRPRYLQKT